MGFFTKKENKQVQDFDYDPEIIAWQREAKGDLDTKLMYIFPESGDNIKEKKYFAVKDYERALFFNKGEMIGILDGGVYELEKEGRVKGTEIVWIDTSIINIPWGIPKSSGIPTRDGFLVGLYGDLKLRIIDAKTFYYDLVAGHKDWKVQDLKDWILGLLTTSLRDIFKHYGVKKIILEEREHLLNLVTAKVTEEFLLYGLQLESFNILGIKPPEEFEKKENAISEIQRQEIENLRAQKRNIQLRIKELKSKLKTLQDQLIDGKITNQEYEEKKITISQFIKESKEELNNTKSILSDI
ncbi:MAG: hypothetical protein EU550_00200 [Promethearchaeota archaeon]|nr:MAG: hypothetical protein EU550_00200 [Candidatus Lokiarchaeota archaeon]